MSIEIPLVLDIDGDDFILTECKHCHSYFKIPAEVAKVADRSEVWCPACGQQSKDYIPQTVYDRAENEITILYEQEADRMRQNLQKRLSNSPVEVIMRPLADEIQRKMKSSPVLGLEMTEVTVIKHYDCCQKEVKIDRLLNLYGGYCPFCARELPVPDGHKELRQIASRFRHQSFQLIQCGEDSDMTTADAFLKYLNEEKILANFIKKNLINIDHCLENLENVRKPDNTKDCWYVRNVKTDQEVISVLYEYFNYVQKKRDEIEADIYSRYFANYGLVLHHLFGNYHVFPDDVNKFNTEILRPFIRIITDYLVAEEKRDS